MAGKRDLTFDFLRIDFHTYPSENFGSLFDRITGAVPMYQQITANDFAMIPIQVYEPWPRRYLTLMRVQNIKQ